MLEKIYLKEHQSPVLFSVVYQILYCLIVTIMSFQVKLLKGVPVPQMMIWRNTVQLVITFAVQNLIEDKSSQYIENKALQNKLYLRAFIGGVQALVFFYGISLISLSEAIILICTAPLWTAIFMIYVLKKQEQSYSLLVQIFLCIMGVILVVKPPFILLLLRNEVLQTLIEPNDNSNHLLGVVLIILCAMGLATLQIMMKYIQVNTLVVINYQSMAIIIMGSLVLILNGSIVILTIYEMEMLILMGMIGFAAQALLNQSFAIGNPTQLSLVANIQVIFGLFFDLIFLDYRIDVLSMIGTTIIMGSLIFNGLSK